MIKYSEPNIEVATCDACGASIVDIEKYRENGDPKSPEITCKYLNRAILKNDFGWPDSEFDVVSSARPSFDLCRDCTRKVLAAIGISKDKFCGIAEGEPK